MKREVKLISAHNGLAHQNFNRLMKEALDKEIKELNDFFLKTIPEKIAYKEKQKTK